MSDSPKTAVPETLDFFYEKSNQFRVIHVDGALGGLSGNGRYVVMNLFSERRPIPKRHRVAFNEDGRVDNEPIEIEGKDGIFREVEVSAMLDYRATVSLRNWLTSKLEEWDAIRAELVAQRSSDASSQEK